VAEQLRSSGRVTRGRIGVQIDQVSKEVAEAIGLGRPQGALVRGVEAGAPADKGGIEAGDIILKFDGKAIDKSSDLPRLVGNAKPGSRATVTVLRRGSQRDLTVTVAELEPERTQRRASSNEQRAPSAGPAQPLGLGVSDLTEAQKRELKLRGGVRVEVAEGAAARAGLREGDVIVAVGNVEVASQKEFEQAIARADKSKPVVVQFRRGELAQYALIRPAR
jgi:serine protease Do